MINGPTALINITNSNSKNSKSNKTSFSGPTGVDLQNKNKKTQPHNIFATQDYTKQREIVKKGR